MVGWARRLTVGQAAEGAPRRSMAASLSLEAGLDANLRSETRIGVHILYKRICKLVGEQSGRAVSFMQTTAAVLTWAEPAMVAGTGDARWHKIEAVCLKGGIFRILKPIGSFRPKDGGIPALQVMIRRPSLAGG